jgi:hypothetical protein
MIGFVESMSDNWKEPNRKEIKQSQESKYEKKKPFFTTARISILTKSLGNSLVSSTGILSASEYPIALYSSPRTAASFSIFSLTCGTFENQPYTLPLL